MKRQIRSASVELSADTDWLQAIKQFNAEGVGHVTLNNDKTVYRYASPDKDFYLFGYVRDLPTVVDEVSQKYSDPDFYDVLEAAAKDRLSAHHAFEVSALNMDFVH